MFTIMIILLGTYEVKLIRFKKKIKINYSIGIK